MAGRDFEPAWNALQGLSDPTVLGRPATLLAGALLRDIASCAVQPRGGALETLDRARNLSILKV